MILLDANILIYAHDAGARQHEAVSEWLEDALLRGPRLLLASSPTTAFVRIATDPRVFREPAPMPKAIAFIDALLHHQNVAWVDAGSSHWSILRSLLAKGQVRGPLITDAHVAALAIELGAVLCTTDRDFTRFEGLKTVSPLA